MRFSVLFALLVATLGSPAVAQHNLKNVSYGPHRRHKLDLIVPTSQRPVPVVVCIHGGGWSKGDKADMLAKYQALQKFGYAIASINYRYSTQAVFPAQLHDCQRAIRFLRANADKYNLDAKRFAAVGRSAGGHLAALLGTSVGVKELDGDPDAKLSCAVQSVAAWYPPVNLITLSPPGKGDSPVTKLLGGDTQQKKDLARLADPTTHLDRGDAPMLIIHGTKDALVPVDQSRYLYNAVRKAGVGAQLILVPNAGHGGRPFEDTFKKLKGPAVVVSFLKLTLK